MARAAKLFIQVGADVKDAVKGLDSVGRQVKTLSRDMRTLSTAALVVGGIITIRKTVSAVNSLVQSAADEEAAQLRLRRAIANTGQAISTDLTASLEDWIQTQSRATTFADNDLRNALTQLVLETQDLATARERLTLAEDISAARGRDLVDVSVLLGKVNEDSITQLKRMGLLQGNYVHEAGSGFSEVAAAQQLAAAAGLDYAQALKVVKDGGKAGEGVMKRYSVATKDMFKETDKFIDVAGAIAEVTDRVKGSAGDLASSPAGQWKQLQNDIHNLGQELGHFFLPLGLKVIGFFLKGIKAVRRAFSLLSTDLGGPKITTVRKLWKEIFGVDLPKSLEIVIKGFDDIFKRMSTFVDKVANADSPDSLRAAIKSFFGGLGADVAKGLSDLGAELDKQGAIGLAAKILIGGFTFSVANGATLGVADKILGLLKDSLQIAWLTVALAGGTPTLVIGAGVALGLLGFSVIDSGLSSARPADAIIAGIKRALLAGGIVLGVAGLVAGVPIIAVVGVGVVLGLAINEAFEQTGGDWLNLGRKILEFVRDSLIAGIPGVSIIGAGLKLIIPLFVEMTATTNAADLIGPVRIDQTQRPGERSKASAAGWGVAKSAMDRLATLDDIYAAYDRNHGVMPDWNWAKDILATRPMWSDVQGLWKGGIAMDPMLARIGEHGPEAVIPLDQMGTGFGGTGGGDLHLHFDGPVYGMLDFEDRVAEIIREGVRAGGFRGIIVR